MKKVVSVIALSGWILLSFCTAIGSGGQNVGANAMQIEHGAGHAHGHGESHHRLSEMPMGCCAVVSSGAIVPELTFIPLFLAGIAFLMVYSFFIPQQLFLHLFRPPRSRSLFQ
jgi:hypothetical protein